MPLSLAFGRFSKKQCCYSYDYYYAPSSLLHYFYYYYHDDNDYMYLFLSSQHFSLIISRYLVITYNPDRDYITCVHN